ncbi:hypothetical protein HAX54_010908 [Datura stramonium]|uniref:Peptidase S74 domain-containing protein n=1 Tax=Datura stramonium TaxID=4076 RepID=A0ABS8TH13_DATST|nr:hypothetical protein [Datura stramonium]
MDSLELDGPKLDFFIVFERLDIPTLKFEPYSHYDVIDYYETRGYHKDVLAEDDTTVEVCTAPYIAFIASAISSLVRDHEILRTEAEDLRVQIARNEKVVAS